MMPSLTETFASALPKGILGQLSDEPGSLESILEGCVRLAREAHPNIRLSSSDFCKYLAARLPEDHSGTAAEWLVKLPVADLFLACGCVLGEPEAAAILSARLQGIESDLSRLRLPRAAIEEVRQSLLEHLLVAKGKDPPKIVNYAGRGDLNSWLRVAAVRTAQKLLRREQREIPAGDELPVETCGFKDDMELEYFQDHHREDFRLAFQEAVMELTRRERNILRLSVIEGLTLEQIGAVFHTHHSTAARQLARARHSLAEGVRKHLAARLRTSPSETDSLMRLVDSQLDLSLKRCLKNSPQEKPPKKKTP